MFDCSAPVSMPPMNEPRNDRMCDLARSTGLEEPCPGEPCAFWGDDGCSLAGLRTDLACNRALGSLLLGLRRTVEAAPQPFALTGLDS